MKWWMWVGVYFAAGFLVVGLTRRFKEDVDDEFAGMMPGWAVAAWPLVLLTWFGAAIEFLTRWERK